MNDRYLYRAKRTDNEEWINGDLITTPFIRNETQENIPYIIDITKADYDCFEDLSEGNGIFEVEPSTICQCTGMTDKKEKIAYEHDIIKTPVGNARIEWNCSQIPTDNHIDVGFRVFFFDEKANDNYRHDLGYWLPESEVIGNIFDNPELVEVGE